MSVNIGLTLAEAYEAITGMETIQYGTKFMVNNSGTWVEASESVLYNVIKNGGAKAVGSVTRITPHAAKFTGIGVEYSTIVGQHVQTAVGSLPTTQEILFKVPTSTSGRAFATPAQLTNSMRSALQNSGAQVSRTALQPITKMEIVQSGGATAIKTTAKGILTKVPWSAVMRGVSVAQGVQLGVDFVEKNPELATKLSNAVFGTDIDPSQIASIVENTTVWANIRDGAIFISEDVIEAIKDVYLSENVFESTNNDGDYMYSGVAGSIVVTSTAKCRGNHFICETRWEDMVIEKTYPNQEIVFAPYKPLAVPNSENSDYYYLETPDIVLFSLDQFTVKGKAGGASNKYPYDSSALPSYEMKDRNLKSYYGGLPSPHNVLNSVRISYGGGWGTNALNGDRTGFTSSQLVLVPSNNEITMLKVDLEDTYGSGQKSTANELRRQVEDYLRNGNGTIMTPPSPGTHIPGLSLINGSTFPQRGRPLREDYPTWFGNGVDTISDIDDGGQPTNNRWYPVNIFEPETQPQAQDGTTPDDDKRKSIIDTIDNSLEDNIQNDPQTEPQPSTYPDPNPEPGTDLQRVNPNPPSIDASDGDSPDPTTPILTTAITSGLAYVYNPTLTETRALGRKLWTANFVENLKKIFVNPMDGIIGFHILYATPKTKAPEEIVLGYYGTEITSKVVSNQYVTVDCGRIVIDEVFHDARDYDPYTTAALYLPFVGIVDLRANDIVNSYINVKYNVDVLTGTCIAFVDISRKGMQGTLYQFVGNCAVELPLSSGNYTAIITSLLSVASSAVGGAMIGGVPGALFGGFKGASINAARSKMQVIQSGNLGANAGAMGIRKPFVMFRRPVTKDAYTYNTQYGYPANKWVMLGDMNGFTRVRSVHIDFINCTNEEEQMIVNALKEGVQL